MDLKVSQKEERLQPGVGLIDTYIPDVFELYMDLEDDTILTVETLEDADELEQAALFASIRQRGSDPLDTDLGIRWAELMLGEISATVVLAEVKSAVRDVSSNCDVVFETVQDGLGNSTLAYVIQVAQS